MAETVDHFEIRPAPVEVMSADEVAAITSRYDELIAKLEADLAVALREAEVAESRLRTHPAAHVVDDDFEAFVLWATESQVVDIRREDGDTSAAVSREPSARVRPGPLQEPPRPNPTRIHDTPIYDAHIDDARIDVGARIEELVRSQSVEPPTRLATPVVTADPVTPPRSRRTGRTTVVTRPGSTTSTTPTPAPAPAAARQETSYVVRPPVAADPITDPEPAAAEPSEKFWDDGRTTRPSRAERDAARGRSATFPATLLMQAGAVIVIVAILVLKLG